MLHEVEVIRANGRPIPLETSESRGYENIQGAKER